jgi:hypothetical protein
MNKYSHVNLIALLSGLCCVGHADAREPHMVTVRASTTDEIVAAMVAASSSGRPTVIEIAPGDYQFTQTFVSNDRSSSLPAVHSTIYLVGRDAATTILDGQLVQTRILSVEKGGNLLLRNMTIENGFATCDSSCDFSNPGGGNAGGGAALNSGGEMKFEDCIIAQNSALDVSHIVSMLGGAILNLGGHFELDGTAVTGNTSMGNGGAVGLNGGSGTIRHSTINGNSGAFATEAGGGGVGGAVDVVVGKLNIDASTISDNVAGDPIVVDIQGYGGGIYNTSGEVWLRDSAVTGNMAAVLGFGGGIYNSGKMVVENSTVGGNAAPTLGGGIYNSGTLALQGVTIADNTIEGHTGDGLDEPFVPSGCSVDTPQLCISSGGGIWNEPTGTVRIATTVIAGNFFAVTPTPEIVAQHDESTGTPNDCDGVLSTEGHNAIGNNTNCTLRPVPEHPAATGDKVNLDPKLGELQDDGEPGNAHYPLLGGSPLIDAGGPIGSHCTPHDQIGEPRVDAGRYGGEILCDIGAIEFQPPRAH